MADELRKGVTIGAGNAEKAAAQNETVVETSEEETKEIIRANEDDFIQGLIAAAGFATEERQRIEIIREGRLYFAFEIRPLGSEEYDKCREITPYQLSPVEIHFLESFEAERKRLGGKKS